MDQFHDDEDRILSDGEIEKLTGASPTTQWRERKAGRWPPKIEISANRKGNTLGQIRQLMRERKAEAETRAKAAVQEPRGRGRPRKSLMNSVEELAAEN